MEERGRDAETHGKGPAGIGSSWGCQGVIWDLATCRDGQCGPAGMGERAQRGGGRGQTDEANWGRSPAQPMPLKAHSTRPVSQTHAEASWFCSFITHRPGMAKQQPAKGGRGELQAERPSEMLSKGATILMLGKDSLQPTKPRLRLGPAGAPWCTPTPSIRSPHRRRGEGGFFHTALR